MFVCKHEGFPFVTIGLPVSIILFNLICIFLFKQNKDFMQPCYYLRCPTHVRHQRQKMRSIFSDHPSHSSLTRSEAFKLVAASQINLYPYVLANPNYGWQSNNYVSNKRHYFTVNRRKQVVSKKTNTLKYNK